MLGSCKLVFSFRLEYCLESSLVMGFRPSLEERLSVELESCVETPHALLFHFIKMRFGGTR